MSTKVNVKDRVEDNTIDLSLSELTEVPVREIAVYKRATTLDLSSNNLTSLGDSFCQLTHLTKLDLSKNQIEALPEEFGKLKNLRHLDLYNNKIENLPLSFGNLTNLKYLDLKSNPLSPSLSKVAGLCLTTRDCTEAAKNTVKFLAYLQQEVEKANEKLRLEDESKLEIVEVKKSETQKSKKKKKKSKKSKMDNQASTVLHAQDNANNHNIKTKNSDNYHESGTSPPKSSSIFMSLLIFCLILFANILFVYLVYGNNKELTDSVISIIPHNYRQGIVETLNKVGVFTFFERTSDIVRRTLGLEHFRIRTFDHAD